MQVVKIPPLELVTTAEILEELGKRFEDYLIIYKNKNGIVSTLYEGFPINLLALVEYGKLEIMELLKNE